MTAVGTVIAGRYRLVDQLAVGGMGSVWRAWDELLERPVAVKQLLTQPGLSHEDTDTARMRIIREARITARLHHPNAVTLYDVVEDEGHPCLIMQYVPSKSLSTLIRESGPVDIRFATRTGAELASALATAHRVGVVHRDVKPGNVLITEDGSAKLTDFGISHAVGDVTLTSTGVLTGTPAFLAPEVARGEQSGFPADVFSLGATLYAALEGFPPFGTDPNPMAVLHRVASGKMLPPQQTGPLTPLITRMLSTDPSARPTMTEVGATLNGRLTQEPERSDSHDRSTFALTVSEEADRQAAHRQRASLPPASSRAPASRAPASQAPARQVSHREPSHRLSAPPPAARTLAAPMPILPDEDPAAAAGTASGPPAPPAFPATRDDAPRRRRPAVLIAAAIVALVVTAAVLGLLLNRSGDNPTAAGDPTTGSAPSSAASASPPGTRASAAPATRPAAPAPAGSTAASPSTPSAAASSAAVSTGATTPSAQRPTGSQPPATTRPGNSRQEPARNTAPKPTAAGNAGGNGQGRGAPTAAELSAAITDYYAAMPADTDQGWSRLTANFQNGVAQNRDYYDSFWGGIDRVTAEDVTASPPDSAEATITYFFKDGRVSTERTAYTLVEQDGVVKIDNSSVISSRTS